MENRKRYRGTIVKEGGMFYFMRNNGKRYDISQNNEVRKCYEKGCVVVVESTSVDPSFEFVRILEALGEHGDPIPEGRAIAIEYNLIKKRSPLALEEGSRIPKSVSLDQIKGITDYRDIPGVTIDPDTAHNFDDLVYAKRNPDGTYTLMVAITNIAACIDPKSQMFAEADEIGIDAYVGDLCYSMFDKSLAGDTWSLIEGEDRLAMCTTCTVNPDGTLKDYKIEPAVVRNRHRLTYKEADAIAFGENAPGDTQDHSAKVAETKDVHEVLRDLYEVARILFKGRMSRGAFDIDSRTLKFLLDESGTIVEGYEREQSEEFTSVIEETALLHNEIWGEVAEQLGIPFYFRNHKNIDPMKIDELRYRFEDYGIKLPKPLKSKDIQKIIDQVRGKKIDEFVVSNLLKAMEAAYSDTRNTGHTGLAIVPMDYRSNKGAYDSTQRPASKNARLDAARHRFFTETGRHNGLAFEGDINHSAYAWASSVVRRMVDLYNQLQMLSVIELGKPMFTSYQLDSKVDHLNEAEQNANRASIEYNKMLGAKYASQNIGMIFPECRIVDIGSDSVTIMTPDGYKMTMNKKDTGIKSKYLRIGAIIENVKIKSANLYPPQVYAVKSSNGRQVVESDNMELLD